MSSDNIYGYTNLKNVQILISLLKAYGIKDIVLSPGGRNVPFVHSVENDKDFSCYSVVDERSAGFFALGLIHALKRPVAICCTSATAVCNYMSSIEEASYQHLPLVVLTADRNQYYLNQDEDQMISQINIFKEICKSEVTLPLIKDASDEWYCGRVINEALSEINHHGTGPVHINFQVERVSEGYDTKVLPNVKKIARILPEDADKWEEAKQELSGKKILIIYGQHLGTDLEEHTLLEKFADQYNCVIAADHLANFHGNHKINTFLISNTLTFELLNKLLPDVVISIGGNYVSEIRGWLKKHEGKFIHWKISEQGNFADQFKNLTKVFECNNKYFLDYFIKDNSDVHLNIDYYSLWASAQENVELPDFNYSAPYAVGEFMKNLPKGAKLHLANSNSVRLAQYFALDPSIEVFCNRGCNGIDGSLSSFVGMASATEEICYLLIGDLSFFYDMNGLWNRYIRRNIRIMLNNNSGASIFHVSPGETLLPTIDKHTAAEHFAVAEGWVESRNFTYLSAHNKEEFDEALKKFNDTANDKAIFLEVFTDKSDDAKEMKQFYNSSKKKNLLSGSKSVLFQSIMNRITK